MDKFFYYTPHYLLIMFLIITVATGIIFFKKKKKENAFIFIAFLIYCFILILNIFVVNSTTIDPETNITTQVMGVLSLTQTQTLEITANLLLSIGFVIKAYAIVKKT